MTTLTTLSKRLARLERAQRRAPTHAPALHADIATLRTIMGMLAEVGALERVVGPAQVAALLARSEPPETQEAS